MASELRISAGGYWDPGVLGLGDTGTGILGRGIFGTEGVSVDQLRGGKRAD